MPRIAVETSSFQLNHRLLEEGPFLGLLPVSVLPALQKNSALRIVPVSLPDQSSLVGITKLRNRRLGPAADIFIEAARAVAKTMPLADKIRGQTLATGARMRRFSAART
jgi:DNA-binding transcriptional LysR family regulator